MAYECSTHTHGARAQLALHDSPVPDGFSARVLPPSDRRGVWRHITSASLAATITGTPERAVPDGYYWLTVATNWDEAGREETSPENDYTNNEVRGLLRTYYAGRTSAWRSQRRCGSAACRRGRRRSAAASSRSGARSSRARGLSRICAAGSAAWRDRDPHPGGATLARKQQQAQRLQPSGVAAEADAVSGLCLLQLCGRYLTTVP